MGAGGYASCSRWQGREGHRSGTRRARSKGVAGQTRRRPDEHDATRVREIRSGRERKCGPAHEDHRSQAAMIARELPTAGAQQRGSATLSGPHL